MVCILEPPLPPNFLSNSNPRSSMVTEDFDNEYTLVDDSDLANIYDGPWKSLEGQQIDVNGLGYSPLCGTLHTTDTPKAHYNILYTLNGD